MCHGLCPVDGAHPGGDRKSKSSNFRIRVIGGHRLDCRLLCRRCAELGRNVGIKASSRFTITSESIGVFPDFSTKCFSILRVPFLIEQRYFRKKSYMPRKECAEQAQEHFVRWHPMPHCISHISVQLRRTHDTPFPAGPLFAGRSLHLLGGLSPQ